MLQGNTTDCLFSKGKLDIFWQQVAYSNDLFEPEQEIFYLYIVAEISATAVCQALEINNKLFNVFLESIYSKFKLDPELGENRYICLKRKLNTLYTEDYAAKCEKIEKIEQSYHESVDLNRDSIHVSYFSTWDAIAIEFDSFEKLLEWEESDIVIPFNTLEYSQSFLEVLNDEKYFYFEFFPLIQRVLKQSNLDWVECLPQVIHSLCSNVLYHLNRSIPPDNYAPLFRHLIVNIVKDLARSQEVNSSFCYFEKEIYSFEDRNILKQEVIYSYWKALLDKCEKNDIRIDSHNVLLDYLKISNSWIISDSEKKQLLSITEKACYDSNLNWALQEIDRFFVLKLGIVDSSSKFAKHQQTYLNFKLEVEKCYDQILIEALGTSNIFKLFRPTSNKTNCLLLLSINIFLIEYLVFNQFSALSKCIFSLINWQDLRLFRSFDSQTPNHYQKIIDNLQISFVVWDIGQCTTFHDHPNFYDAIYVYQGALAHERKCSDQPVPRKIIESGEMIVLDFPIEHNLYNYDSTQKTMSVHLQSFPVNVDRQSTYSRDKKITCN
ncbi:hypothetical protein I4641_21065 [Waterburya agarophytonicola K14]|uniref:Uncharacterized protein n=1 Tax=Waterburya agarophytonicola KI4 TaxID=2874699 RepID=A0A964BUK3_9CYAN|nr:hypothetical protein [Waterburya agarophytonicola]MCC0179454.1 hypothetical protein [Waterburya agarophytonicola KI4]